MKAVAAKQPFSLGRFLKKAVVITAILAAIEIPFVYFYFAKQQPNVVAESEVKTSKTIQPTSTAANAAAAQVSTKSAPILYTEQTPAPIVNTQTVVETVTPQPVEPPAPKKEAVKPATEPKKPDTIAVKPITPVAPSTAVTLTNQQFEGIVENVVKQKEQLQASNRCVKIVQAKNSNVSNGFAVAAHLKKAGFIISGRESSSTNSTGVKVDASGECIRLVIGKM